MTKIGGSGLSKKYYVLIVLLVSVVLFGCNSNEGGTTKTDPSTVYFSGTISEINDQIAIVRGEIGGTTGNVYVDLSVNESESFQVGDEVKVGYDGIVLESEPAQIKTLSVELVE